MLRKVVQVRDQKYGEFHEQALTAFHLLPGLLNQTKFYDEAVQSSHEAIKRETTVHNENSLVVMESTGELAVALGQTGDKKQAERAITKIKETAKKTMSPQILRVLESVEIKLWGRVRLATLEQLTYWDKRESPALDL